MLSSTEIDYIEDLYSKNKHKLEEVVELKDNEKEYYQILDKSHLLGDYNEVYYYKNYSIQGCSEFSNIVIIKVNYKLRSGKYNMGNNELQIVRIKSLKSNFGNIFIRPETIEDKFTELFCKTEIDYKEYPKFSSKYYLLAENEQLCHSFATNQRLQLIENQKEIVIHINDNLLIAKYSRLLNDRDFENMLDFLKNI